MFSQEGSTFFLETLDLALIYVQYSIYIYKKNLRRQKLRPLPKMQIHALSYKKTIYNLEVV